MEAAVIPDPSCLGCPISHIGQGFCKSDGTGEYGVLLWGEALGEQEVAAGGLPFQGPAGKVLDRILARAVFEGNPVDRSKFKIGNALFCRPGGNSNDLPQGLILDQALGHCRRNLDKVVQEMKPKVIVALGDLALKTLTNRDGITYWRGSVLESPYGWVIPTFHPSYIMRGNFRYAQVVTADILRALTIAREGVTGIPTHYELHPTRQDVERFRDDYIAAGKPVLAFDIETNYSAGEDEDKLEEIHLEETNSYQITRISFSFREGKAITMAWQPPYQAAAIELLGLAPELTSWNGESFDIPRLVADGAVIMGHHYDSMHLFHMYAPSLPYNLQFASSLIWGNNYQAWKKTAEVDMERYSCVDSDSCLRNFNYCQRSLQENGRWDVFLEDFVEMGSILRRMSQYGIGTDRDLRKQKREEFQKRFMEVCQAVQQAVPLDVKPRKVFKSSEKALRKRFPNLGGPEWVKVQQELTEKEVLRAQKKLEREAKKAAEKERKRQEREAKRKARKA